MIKYITVLVHQILRKNHSHSLFRTIMGGVIIRYPRLKKFKKKSKKLILLCQLIGIWYFLILTGSYLSSYTGAYFNDEEQISGSISAVDDFCKDVEKGSDFWKQHCKDNSGIGNGPDMPDDGSGKGNDPDNPGQNIGSCDDHTKAPCSEVRNLNEKHTSNSISLSWSNPNWSDKSFSYVNVYRNGDKTPICSKITNGKFDDVNLDLTKKYTYKITTVDKLGNESSGLTIDITISN